jgi:hypothetical protein
MKYLRYMIMVLVVFVLSLDGRAGLASGFDERDNICPCC